MGWYLGHQRDLHLEQHSGRDCQKVQRKGRNFHWDFPKVKHWELLMGWH